MAEERTYDVIIIGGGHNGLVCACYLAKAGLSVKVLERRSVLGGAAVTEEFHPGFRNSVASYTVSLLNPKIIRDLKLKENGLRIVERKTSNLWLHENNDYLIFHADMEKTQAEIARFSKADAKALPAYYAAIDRIADMLRDLVLQSPPNMGGGLSEIISALRLGRQMRALSDEDRRVLLALFTKSAAEFLDQWFEHDAVKAAFAFDGVVGTFASPYTPGTAYVLLHHCFGEVNGKKGVWGHAIGGMGAITQAMAREAEKRGVHLETDAPVAKVVVEGGRAKAVVLEDGRIVKGKAVAANVNPRLLYDRLIETSDVPQYFHTHMQNWACHSATFRMNVALSELPQFHCLPGTDVKDHHSAGIIIGSSIDYMDAAYMDAQRDGWSKAPIVEMLIPSVLDPTLAPEGQHVASLFCQHFRYDLPDGQSWDDCREAAADTIIDNVARYSPNFKDSVLGRQILSPLDLERTFGLIGGDIFHGRLSLDQMFSARPILGHADYRSPIEGLYHCGSGTHPGGGVTGAPGHNAAVKIVSDMRKNRFSFWRD